MSLLMDALRKAEEAKKKAEQGDDDKQETPEQEVADQESVTPSTELSPESADPQGGESSNIPDVALEFEPEPDSQVAKESIAAVPATPGAEISSDSADDSLRLEPIDEQLRQSARQPFDSEHVPDYSAEIPASAGTEDGAPESMGSAESDLPAKEYLPAEESAQQDQAEDSTTEGIGVETDQEAAGDEKPSPYGVVVKDPEAVRAALNAGYEKVQAKQNLERAMADPPAPVRDEVVETEPELPAQKDSQKEVPAEPEEKLQLTPQKQTISERSASGRSGAKNLFAAKQQGKGKRLRIRRSTKIWAAQITIGVMVLIGAYIYFFVINSSTDSFNVPQQYLANQETFSENFNESLEDSEVVEEPVNEEVIPLDGDFDFEIPADVAIEPPPLADEPVIAEAPVTQELIDAQPVVTEEVTSVAVTDPEPEVVVSETVESTAPDEVALDDLVVVESGTEVATAVTLSSSQGPSNSISFTRTQSNTGINPDLSNAYAAYQRDDLQTARDLYQQVLIETPLNRDALLGLAVIASRAEESNLAMELYSRMLARDPSDAVARAGLMGLRPLGGPEQQERELRRLMELHPQVAPISYALGNFYALQDRWSDAQRYYFNALQQAKTDALQGMSVNPDYAFNLAVSLEHLNQVAPAQTYYREAIDFAGNFPAGFDVNIARERLANLIEVNQR